MGTAAITGSLSAVGPGSRTGVQGLFNVSLTGGFVGTVQLERSFDGGTTWEALTALGTPWIFSGACSETFAEPEDDVLYRLNCTAYTSGPINYRISQ